MNFAQRTLLGMMTFSNFYFPSVQAAASVSARRHLSQTIRWASCNKANICYTLTAQTADIGNFDNRTFTDSLVIDIYKKDRSGNLHFLRQIKAREGQWNMNENLWTLKIEQPQGIDREYIFNPDNISPRRSTL